ncbi:MAG: cytochrome b/b6 domain-containing protein [Methylomonas sp.]|jgi:cytochrome b
MALRVPIWDLPTRVFHWALALNFFGAYVTGESERWALLHITFGYTLLGLIVFRLVWGLVGGRYARFTQFVTGPAAVSDYIASLIRRRPIHYAGHNPAGALAIAILLLLGLVSAVSGWLVYEDAPGDWLEELHETVSFIMLLTVFIHIAGVLISSRLHGENLVLAMIDGRKKVEDNQSITRQYPLVALFLLVSMLTFWLWSFKDSLPMGAAFADFLSSFGFGNK